MTEKTEGQAAHEAETVAIAFHEAYEALAPEFGYRTREASAKPWDEVPANNASLMVATADRLLKSGVVSFGKPSAESARLRGVLQAVRAITEPYAGDVLPGASSTTVLARAVMEQPAGDGPLEDAAARDEDEADDEFMRDAASLDSDFTRGDQ